MERIARFHIIMNYELCDNAEFAQHVKRMNEVCLRQ